MSSGPKRKRTRSKPAEEPAPSSSTPSSPAPISVRAYARHRGCSHTAIQRAISTGRLAASIVRLPGKPPKVLAAVADQEWDRNRNPAMERDPEASRPRNPATGPRPAPSSEDQPAAPPGLNFQQARAVREAYRARLIRLEYEERVGILVRADLVRASAHTAARAVRDHLLSIPGRLREQLAEEVDPDRIAHLIREEIVSSLEGLQSLLE